MVFRRKGSKEPETMKVIREPKTAEDFQHRGWIHHSKGEQEPAVADFRQALSMDASLIEARYGLAMSLKFMGHHAEALETFQGVLNMLEVGAVDNSVRRDMLKRLVKVQILNLSQPNQAAERPKTSE